MKGPVIVVPYDPEWPLMFQKEAQLIKKALGNNCLEVHHIGSTSVPGLPAKPIIDILPVVKKIVDVDQATFAMEQLGYETKGEGGMAFRRFFQKGKEARTHHVHVYEEGDTEISRYLKFRDWLRSHPNDAQAYARVKLELSKKYPDDLFSYCVGKDAFVDSIDLKDGFDGFRMVQALTPREWEAVRSLKKQSNVKSIFLQEPSELKSVIDFVFYKNSAIIGYVQLKLYSDQVAILTAIVIKESERHQGFGRQLLKLAEKWLTQQGIKRVYIDSTDDCFHFFDHHGYKLMSCKDLQGSVLCKIL